MIANYAVELLPGLGHLDILQRGGHFSAAGQFDHDGLAIDNLDDLARKVALGKNGRSEKKNDEKY
jgi:hypothetical protein